MVPSSATWSKCLLAVVFCASSATTATAQLCGDSDANGQVTVTDGVNVLRAAARLSSTCTQNFAACDTDGNAEISVSDGVNVLRAAAALSSTCDVQVGQFIATATTIFGPLIKTVGSPPNPNGGPSLTTEDSAIVINGGTKETTISSSTPMTKIFLSVDASSPAAIASVEVAGVGAQDGFFQIDLPSPQSSVTIAITTNQAVPTDSFTWIFQGADEEGLVGDPAPVDVAVTQVGTGDVQVNVQWNTASDVDLHVVDPTGEEIYYGSRTSQTGGTLDLDSNPNCVIDHVNAENVTWQTGTAPHGHYIVRVDYYAACDQAATDYVVTVNVHGQPLAFSGHFVGPGDQGGTGSGTTITEFEF
jgi:hypothetical protein